MLFDLSKRVIIMVLCFYISGHAYLIEYFVRLLFHAFILLVGEPVFGLLCAFDSHWMPVSA